MAFCPASGQFATAKCPFLHNVLSQGIAPSGGREPVLPEDDSFSATFALFHGPRGVLPLPNVAQSFFAAAQAPSCPEPASEPPRCPVASLPGPPTPVQPAHQSAPFERLAAAPLASMSMSWGSNWFNLHHLFKQHLHQHRAQQRRPPPQESAPSSAPAPAPAPLEPLGSGAAGSHHIHGAGPGGATAGGKCPLRTALGPLAGFVFNKQGQIACPEPIIKMRAALAATKPVRELRPQILPVKLFAVALTTAALNVPCGMWREHTEKFSSQWFVAVHATIPFIAMLRKAVIMPKYAILFTIAAAIAGQAMGARIERRRTHGPARDELAGLRRASAAAAAVAAPCPLTAEVQGPAAAVASVVAAPSGGGAGRALPVAAMHLTSHGPVSGAGLAVAGVEAALAAAVGAAAGAGTQAGASAGGAELRFVVRGGRRGGGGGARVVAVTKRGAGSCARAAMPAAMATTASAVTC